MSNLVAKLCLIGLTLLFAMVGGFAQNCNRLPGQYQIEVDPFNSSKCRLVFVYPRGFLPEIKCGRPNAPVAGSDATFESELLFFEVKTAASTTVVYDKPDPSTCTGSYAKLQYHPTIPNAVMTAYGTQFCTMRNLPFITITTKTTNDRIGSTCQPENPNPLPVEWVSFQGSATGRRVQLTWVVASQLNNKLFEVQHSQDGQQFRTLGVVQGDGTSSERKTFTYLHSTASAGSNYYRLRQVDFDGTFAFSTKINVRTEKKTVATVFPNFTNSSQITLNISAETPSVATVKLVNQLGNTIAQRELDLEAGDVLYPYVLPEMVAGIYFIQIQVAGRPAETHKFIKTVK